MHWTVVPIWFRCIIIIFSAFATNDLLREMVARIRSNDHTHTFTLTHACTYIITKAHQPLTLWTRDIYYCDIIQHTIDGAAAIVIQFDDDNDDRNDRSGAGDATAATDADDGNRSRLSHIISCYYTRRSRSFYAIYIPSMLFCHLQSIRILKVYTHDRVDRCRLIHARQPLGWCFTLRNGITT